MFKAQLPGRAVPRVEYDHRARVARVRLEQLERLLVARRPVRRLPFRLLKLLAVNISGSGRKNDKSTGSSSDRRPCGMPVPRPWREPRWRYGMPRAGCPVHV
jgi:hypothetical protein